MLRVYVKEEEIFKIYLRNVRNIAMMSLQNFFPYSR